MKVSAALGVTAGTVALAAGTYIGYNALGGADPEAQFDIEAEPRVIDEGELVEFDIKNTRYLDPQTGQELEIDPAVGDIHWDFDDGVESSGRAQFWTRHRFADDRVGGYEVSARIFNSRNWIKVQVNNVAPEIRGIQHSRPALKMEDIEFEGVAVDPGINDELTFNWDFGDGESATGHKVKHAYDEDGVYQVTLKVDDGDLGEDEWTETVIVGEVGSYTVSGDISTGEIKAEQIVFAGSTSNPLARLVAETNKEKVVIQDPCELRIDMGSPTSEVGISLSANLRPGLGQRRYSVGVTSEWDGTYDPARGGETFRNPGVFFADLGAPPRRNARGQMVGGAFWSQGGTVSVDYFDGEFVELSFKTHLIENIPPTFGPRQVQVTGVLAQKLDRSIGGVLEGIGTVMGSIGDAMEQMAAGIDDPAETPAHINFYLCDVDETKTFDIESKIPEREAVNTEFENPEIEVRFTEKVKQSSIHDGMHLVWRTPTGAEDVPGSWHPTPGDPKSVTFTPQALLKQGTIYCVGVRVGKDGVRGQDDEMLEPGDTSPFSQDTQAACQSPAAGTGFRMWAFSTRPEFTSANVDVYQVSVAGDGVPLVAGKPAASRVYTNWDPPANVHPAAQVKKTPARIRVLAHGSPVYAPKKVKLKRPDLFTSAEKKNAKNSTNFFNWLPAGSGSVAVKAKIELLDKNNQPVEEFETSETELSGWNKKEALRFDFRFVKVKVDYSKVCEEFLEEDCANSCSNAQAESGVPVEACVPACVATRFNACIDALEQASGGLSTDWADEIDPETRAAGHTLMLEGAQFTTQNFPVVQTRARARPDLEVEVLEGESWFAMLDSIPEKIFAAGADSDADVLVGLLPPGVHPGWLGIKSSSFWQVGDEIVETKVVLLQVGRANAGNVAHEFGHFFLLDHSPGEDPKASSWACPPQRPAIQGLRVGTSGAGGANKHGYECNQQSGRLVSLMHPSTQPVADAFIRKVDYRKLFHTIVSDPPQQQAHLGVDLANPGRALTLTSLLLPSQLMSQVGDLGTQAILVTGSVAEGEIRLSRVRHTAGGTKATEPPPGPLVLELLDRSGSVARAIPFGVTPPDPWHGDPEGPSSFRLELPAPVGLSAVRVRGPEGAEATRERSPSSPTIEVEVASAPDGTRSLTWSARDDDGDGLLADVFVRADEGHWHGAAIDTPNTELTLAPWELPAGQRITARIVVSDGFNTASTEVDLGEGAPISILTTIPADGATDVETSLDVVAWVSNPMIETDELMVRLPNGSFTLTGPKGEEVFADVAYQPGTGVVTMTPVEPLRPGTRYIATIEGLEDVWGNELAESRIWSFTTTGGAESSEATN